MHTFWLHPEYLPKYALETPVVQHTLELLGPLDWSRFPERNLVRHWCQPAIPCAAFAGAVLANLNEGLDPVSDLCQYRVEHPGLIPLLGFRVIRSEARPHGFNRLSLDLNDMQPPKLEIARYLSGIHLAKAL